MQKKNIPQSAHLLKIDPAAIDNSSLMLSKLSNLFRESTGLDAFFFFQDQSVENWEQKPLSKCTTLPLFCMLLQSQPEERRKCRASHRDMALESVQSKCPLCQHCHAGLLTFHHPVYIDGKGTGVIQTVCAISQKKKVRLTSLLRKKIRKAKIPEIDLTNAIHEMRTISKEQSAYLFDWLELIVNYLAENSKKASQRKDNDNISTKFPTIDYPEIEHQLRSEVGQAAPLPSWRAQRCTGCSALVIEQVIKFIRQNYFHPLSSQEIAHALGYEPSYFAKIFKRYAKESFTEILRKARLNKARELLKNPNLSITEVAQQSGFCNPSFFTCIFRNVHGITPKQYRSTQLC